MISMPRVGMEKGVSEISWKSSTNRCVCPVYTVLCDWWTKILLIRGNQEEYGRDLASDISPGLSSL